MNAESTAPHWAQFNIKRLMLVTMLVAIAIGFPQFAVAVPFALGMSLLVLLVIGITWAFALIFEGPPSVVRKAAIKNMIAISVVIVALIAYGAYGYFALDWDMG